ncbi:MAG: hypothetical protein M3R55_02330 [Acidobacteriota bacterium]|nr:hypothetical protein [Acidobacteriota bacterium]
MKTWTPDASQHFEAWLGRARVSIAGDPSIDPDEVAHDLRAHVHAELEAMPEPVTVKALDSVLSSLGNPTQWSDTVRPAAERPARWYRHNVADAVADSQRALAGEWGMPVLLALLTLLSIPTFGDGGAVLLVVAYIIARAQVRYSPRKLTGSSRWLLYMPLAVGNGLLAGMVLSFPITLGMARHRFEIVFIMGVWLIIVGMVAAREPKRVQAAMRPFAGGFTESHGQMIALAGAALAICAAVILLSNGSAF